MTSHSLPVEPSPADREHTAPHPAQPSPVWHACEADPMHDLQERWTPSDAQRAAAAALLATVTRTADWSRRWCVLVPLTQPGKTRGVWTVGQRVVHPAGAWLADTGPGADGTPYGYGAAREAATRAAEHALRLYASGTAAFGVLYPDGRWRVTEA